MPFIEIKDLVHVYHPGLADELRALDGVSLEIGEGEFVAVLGMNGSGKSTLAKHLNALLLPTSGHCLVNGLDTAVEADLWKIRRQVGMVFQNPDNQLVAAVVEDDIAFGPENLGVPPEEIRCRVRESLKAVGMERFRKFAPHLLSGGQKQRIAVAGALAMETKCLVLDEPTAMLDPQGRAEVMAVVKKLHATRGITVVLITHFMEEAAEAERIVIMEKGRVVKQGGPQEIFSDLPSMKKWGLDVPLPVEIADILRKKGLSLPDGICTQEQLVSALTSMVPKERLCPLN